MTRIPGQRARTILLVSAKASPNYWNDWATETDRDDELVALETKRRGDDGRSDAQYIVDRMASGLHYAVIVGTD